MSVSRLTLDANILIYAFDTADAHKHAIAQMIVAAAAHVDCPLSLQAVGEFYAASTRRQILPAAMARVEVNRFLDVFESFTDSESAHRTAADAAAKARFSYWDAVMLSSASDQGCEIILSEAMHDGAKLGSIVVRNPFGPSGLSPAAKQALGV